MSSVFTWRGVCHRWFYPSKTTQASRLLIVCFLFLSTWKWVNSLCCPRALLSLMDNGAVSWISLPLYSCFCLFSLSLTHIHNYSRCQSCSFACQCGQYAQVWQMFNFEILQKYFCQRWKSETLIDVISWHQISLSLSCYNQMIFIWIWGGPSCKGKWCRSKSFPHQLPKGVFDLQWLVITSISIGISKMYIRNTKKCKILLQQCFHACSQKCTKIYNFLILACRGQNYSPLLPSVFRYWFAANRKIKLCEK